MKWIETKVIFDSDNMELATELISDAFHSLGITGIVVTDPFWDREQDWAKEASRGADCHSVTGWLPDDGGLRIKQKRLKQTLSELQMKHNIFWKIDSSKIDEEDWAQSTMSVWQWKEVQGLLWSPMSRIPDT